MSRFHEQDVRVVQNAFEILNAPPPPPPPPAEICDDGIDNDLDGDTDCADADCSADPACAPPPPPPAEICDDGIDNDLDGDTDCADADCSADPACAPPPPPPAEVCDDGIDNDLDGDTDCADADCSADPACAPAPACAGGEMSGYLNGSNKDDYYTYATALSGYFEADLSSDPGTEFQLYLEYRSGSRWRRAKRATSHIAYNSSSTREYRWRVKRRNGDGNYHLCITSPTP